jgi:hypothetical protein
VQRCLFPGYRFRTGTLLQEDGSFALILDFRLSLKNQPERGLKIAAVFLFLRSDYPSLLFS